MKFITVPDLKEGTQVLANKIISFLKDGKRVLWLVPGGSNVPITASALDIAREAVSVDVLARLTVAQADERYGPVGYADSNWKQLKDTGVDLSGITTVPILDGSSLEETVVRYGSDVEKVLKNTDVIVGQFGMGADGHIAGIMPHSSAVSEAIKPVVGYPTESFTRVTLTFPILRKISVAYLFVSNATKKEAIKRLRADDVSLADQPADILKEISEAYVYID